MSPLFNVKKMFLISCILSCCFQSDLTVEVTSENYMEHFVVKTERSGFHFSSNSSKITNVSANAFKNVRNIGRFEISHCKQFTAIPENLFYNRETFQNVHTIIFSGTGITHFPKDLFRGLHELRFVMLYDNQMESLHQDLFQSNTNLRHLDISGNKLLKRLPPGLLRNNPELFEIEIWDNQLLEQLPAQIFQNLVLNYGTKFQLQGNGLKYIEHKTFANIDFLKVKRLDLSNNYLVCLPDYFLNATRIPKNIRRNINLNGNCFNETSQICQLYKCMHRAANECENARNSTNVRKCQGGNENSVMSYKAKNGSVIYDNAMQIGVEKFRIKHATSLLYLLPVLLISLIIILVLAVIFCLLRNRRRNYEASK